MHIQDFTPFARSQPKGLMTTDYDPFIGTILHQSANLIAKVHVGNCTKDRAQETGNLAVDVALGSLQLFLTDDGCEHMARLTGRTMPIFSHALSRSGSNITAAISNTEPGRLFGPGYLDHRLFQAKVLTNSFGNRVSAYLGGSALLPALEQTWADAVYWFHEGLAEPLDTIAVPKLETAIKIMLHSESTRGSKARLVKAIQAFYGKKAKDFINPNSQISVEAFAEGFVRDRSRILHGTWSTLTKSLRGSRPSLTMIVRDFLILYSLELDQYLKSNSPIDEIDRFLHFIDQRRQSVTQSKA